MPKLVP